MFKTDLWQSLPLAVQAQFDQTAISSTYKRGQYVYQAGEKPRGMYFIKSGLVGLVIIGQESGKEHLLRFFKSGQFFGHRSLLSEESYHAHALVLESTELVFISADIIEEALEKHPLVYKTIATVLSKELRRCESQHVMILENEIIPRVAQSLIYLKDMHPQHHWTRQEIANFCGSTVSTVIKALAALEKQGLIHQIGRRIEILDRKALLEMVI
jgi:CRP-like cAMP-binding protein